MITKSEKSLLIKDEFRVKFSNEKFGWECDVDGIDVVTNKEESGVGGREDWRKELIVVICESKQ